MENRTKFSDIPRIDWNTPEFVRHSNSVPFRKIHLWCQWYDEWNKVLPVFGFYRLTDKTFYEFQTVLLRSLQLLIFP